MPSASMPCAHTGPWPPLRPQDLGVGASGTVKKAKHKTTGMFVAVKQIQILEKAKRDQMVKELRIMRTHECPWLVSLCALRSHRPRLHA